MESGDPVLPVRTGEGGLYIALQLAGVLMVLIHLEDVVGGGQQHPVPLSEDHGLQYVHQLGNVGHHHSVAVVIEDVQAHGGHQRVPHGVLLVEEAWIGPRLHVEPGAPLVHDQPHLPVSLVVADDPGVVLHQLLHAQGLPQSGEVFRPAEIQGAALMLPHVGDGVVVEAHRVHKSAGDFHQHAGPVVIVRVGPGGDPVGLAGFIIGAEVGGVLAAQVGVELGAHIAAAAPGLVADAPVFHVPGLLSAVGPAQVRHGGLPAHVAILYPVGELLDGAAAHVAGEVGLAPQLAAQLQKLMGAEGVVLRDAAPVGVDDLFTALPGADAVLPVVGVGKAAAGPAQHGDTQSPQGLDHVRAHPVFVGDAGALAHVDAVVDAAPQVFRELAVNIPVDDAFGPVGVDDCL